MREDSVSKKHKKLVQKEEGSDTMLCKLGSRSRMVISYLICEECGSPFPIPRKRYQLRKRGHVKHLWCYRCKKVTAHIEGMKLEREVM